MTGSICNAPYVLPLNGLPKPSPKVFFTLNEKFWTGIIDWMRENPLQRGLMAGGDFRWIQFADTPEQALEIIREEHRKFRDRKEAQGK